MRKIILSLLLAITLTSCSTIDKKVTEWACDRCDREKVCYVKPYLDIDYPTPLTLLGVNVKVIQYGENVGIWMDKQSFDNWILNNKSFENSIILHRDIIEDYKNYYKPVE